MDKARILDNVNGHQKIRDSGRNSNRRQEMQPELSVIGNMVLVVRFTKHQSGIICTFSKTPNLHRQGGKQFCRSIVAILSSLI